MNISVLNVAAAAPGAEKEASSFRQKLLYCCGSTRWAAEMSKRFPLQDFNELCHAADVVDATLTKDDWLEAFAAHPRVRFCSNIAIHSVVGYLEVAKKMLRLLNGEARALLDRLPPSTPKLSPATAVHRDVMLARIRRKKPQADVGVIENKALQVAAQTISSPLHVDEELLEKLQAAWLARSSTTSNEEAQARNSIDVYSTTVCEIVLTELSNVVLWSFKTYFADTAEQPDASQVEAVMRLVRLVDSVALSQGRTYRSVCR
ncbi:OHCU decarboxylase [Phytophthora palmivora]|uniref:OHCU decarboxylase n=1 Tax=Phytophthora palmivora TaxID=4796 RepID=A0A2P4X317_9STRA|nr:OHCU decarboxylase [Phytophthora palmivora]